ncbi:MAG: hypothetical protein ACR2NR_18880 [Solirubrobacteraceae bacterium]
MEVQIDQKVCVPNPDGEPILATVVGFGEPGDAVEVVIEGKPVKRDVAIVRHEEGENAGFIARVPYQLITAARDA